MAVELTWQCITVEPGDRHHRSPAADRLGAGLVAQPGTWRFAAASVRGTAHVGNEAPCQDAHAAYATTRDGQPVMVVAVSDGAGTARAAEIGARTAVNAVIEQSEAWFGAGNDLGALDRDALIEWVKGAREQIADIAIEADASMRDYACTLLIAVIGPAHSTFGQIGDGAIVVKTLEGEWSPVFWPQHGDYANTTYFVTDADALGRFTTDAGPHPVAEVAVFSDGLEQLLLDTKQRSAHAPFFDRMMRPLRASGAHGQDALLSAQLASYLASPTVTDRSNDDVTLVLATRLLPLPVELRPEPATSLPAADPGAEPAACAPEGTDAT